MPGFSERPSIEGIFTDIKCPAVELLLIDVNNLFNGEVDDQLFEKLIKALSDIYLKIVQLLPQAPATRAILEQGEIAAIKTLINQGRIRFKIVLFTDALPNQIGRSTQHALTTQKIAGSIELSPRTAENRTADKEMQDRAKAFFRAKNGQRTKIVVVTDDKNLREEIKSSTPLSTQMNSIATTRFAEFIEGLSGVSFSEIPRDRRVAQRRNPLRVQD